jgi:hypothetical protein
MAVSSWDPRHAVSAQLVGWRARNWRRALLLWSVLSLALTAEAAHLSGRAQDAAGLAVAGIAALLIFLP